MEHGFRLADVQVRPRASSLEVGGVVRRVDFKAMQVLLLLAEHAGETVPKEEIFARVWAQRAVSDDVLTVAISTLRRALGDEARSPRFIQTIPRQGYRLIAPLHAIAAAETAPRVDAIRPWRLALSGALFLGLLGLGLTLGLQRAQQPPQATVPPPIRALAVLPLENFTGDEAQEHLADGTTEALITALARQPDLKVISRTSVMGYKGHPQPLPEIGRALGVDALVEGSVQRFGARLRISAQLIDAVNDHHLWAQTFDGEISDVLALQESVAAAISRQVHGNDAPTTPMTTGSPPSMPLAPEAYEAYLRGRYLARSRSRGNLEKAIPELERAIAAEPSFAAAHTVLGEAHVLLAVEGARAPESAYETARRAAQHALSLHAELARAHTLLAIVHYAYDWDFAAAEAAFERAIDLDPSDAWSRDWHARYLTVMKRFDEAILEVRRLQERDPLAYSRPQVAIILGQAGQPERALAELQAQIEVEPRSAYLYQQLATTYQYLGRLDEALAAFTRGMTLQGEGPEAIAAVEAAFAAGGVASVYRHFHAALRALEARGVPVPAIRHAELLVGAGALDEGLAWLETAYQRREPGLLEIGVAPAYASLRDDPRFQRLLQRIGLPS